MGGENNQVLWRGVQPVEGISGIWPSRNATRINKYKNQSGLGTEVVYEVPEAKKMFISSAGLFTRLANAGSVGGMLYVKDAEGTTKLVIAYHIYDIAGHQSTPMNFIPALEAEAGWEIFVGSEHADMDVYGIISGWLEDA